MEEHEESITLRKFDRSKEHEGIREQEDYASIPVLYLDYTGAGTPPRRSACEPFTREQVVAAF